MNIVDQIAREQMKPKDQVPQFNVGDIVRVHFRIVEGEKERTQVFEGTVIGRSHGEGATGRFTVRRLAYGEGVERIFPLHSPRLEKVEVVRQGSVRRAKLNYLRERTGRATRVKAKGRTVLQEVQGEKPADAAATDAKTPSTQG